MNLLAAVTAPAPARAAALAQVGPATDADVAAIAALNNRFAPHGLTLPRTHAFVAAHLADYRVARERDGRIVGCACLDEYSPSLVELVSLAVEPRAQGRGIGRRLIASLVDLARRRGYPEVFAVSFSDALFQTSGFERTDVARYPEKKLRYDRVSTDEWTIGRKHCFRMGLREEALAAERLPLAAAR
jgi:amino-acid N-acetyltransferase